MVQGGTSQAAPVYPPVHTHVLSPCNSKVDCAAKQQMGGFWTGIEEEYPALHVHMLAGTGEVGTDVDARELLFAGHTVPQFAP